LDPAAQFLTCFDRVFDIHLKDISAPQPDGIDTEIGRGVIDFPKFFKAATQRKFSGTMHFEFEKDKDDPLPGLAESAGYVRGLLAVI
jgi:inosose dehydratase